jgi:membrane protease YdiL (CAAX protease family)
MGVVFGLQRSATGGVVAPVVTHLTWSTLMLRFLPSVLDRPGRTSEPATPG